MAKFKKVAKFMQSAIDLTENDVAAPLLALSEFATTVTGAAVAGMISDGNPAAITAGSVVGAALPISVAAALNMPRLKKQKPNTHGQTACTAQSVNQSSHEKEKV